LFFLSSNPSSFTSSIQRVPIQFDLYALCSFPRSFSVGTTFYIIEVTLSRATHVSFSCILWPMSI
jgi:hypothetical protein